MLSSNASKLLTLLALLSQVRFSLQQDETSDTHTGHTHDLDPAIFADYGATDEPIGTIMTLHLATMVLSRFTTMETFKPDVLKVKQTYMVISVWHYISNWYGAWIGKKPLACSSADTRISAIHLGLL